MVPLLTEPLGLAGMDVEAYEICEDGLILEVEAHAELATCPRCGMVSHQLHQNHRHLVQDLPLSHDRRTWLRVNRRQFKGAVCGKPFSEPLEFVRKQRTYTDRYAEPVVQQVLHSDSANVACHQGLSEDIVWSMVAYMSAKKSVLR